ncbi:hypothetical protein BH09PSE2_BH09PSE2_25910 [soil metagenome]
MGLAIGGAYLAGGLARTAVNHARIERLAADSRGSLSETALKSAAGDAGVLAIAQRFDGAAGSAQDVDDRRLARLALRMGDAPASAYAAPAAGLGASTNVPAPVFRVAAVVAQPFHMRGALDESRDLECLTQAVYYEARGEIASGQEAVAQVVLNRVRHPAFPKSVCGVVFQHAGSGCQFSFACDGSISHHMENAAWRRAERVASAALDGHVAASIGNATHFHVASLGQVWNSGMMKVAQIGSHVFYRFGGSNGAARMFHAEPQISAPLQVAEKPATRLVTAGFAPSADRILSASAAVVEHAAAAVESVTKPAAAKVETPAKPDTTVAAPPVTTPAA